MIDLLTPVRFVHRSWIVIRQADLFTPLRERHPFRDVRTRLAQRLHERLRRVAIPGYVVISLGAPIPNMLAKLKS